MTIGEDFYGAYDAQNFAIENSAALGVTPVPSLNLVYTAEEVSEVHDLERYLLLIHLSYTYPSRLTPSLFISEQKSFILTNS